MHLKLPTAILDKINCIICNNCISCPPVFQIKPGKNICGRCTAEVPEFKRETTRNLLFEQIGAIFLYPCQFFNNGCQEDLKWSEALEHEQKCCFKNSNGLETVACPSLPTKSCSWTGICNKLMPHFKEKHPDLILVPQRKILPEKLFVGIESINHQNMLMEIFAFQFLIHLRQDRKNMLLIGASILNASEFASHFDCHVIRDKDEHIYVTKVCEDIACATEKLNMIELNTNKNFSITIKRINILCLNCSTVSSKLSKNSTCCKNKQYIRKEKLYTSVRILKRCPFFKEGCEHLDDPKNLFKHQIFFCKFTSIGSCNDCSFRVQKSGTGPNLFEHDVKEHISLEFTDRIAIPNTRTEFLGYNKALLKTKYGNFICRWDIKYTMSYTSPVLAVLLGLEINTKKMLSFMVSIISDLPYTEEKGIEFDLKFEDLRLGTKIERKIGKRSKKLPVDIRQLGVVEEWYVDFEIPWNSMYYDFIYHSIEIELIKKPYRSLD